MIFLMTGPAAFASRPQWLPVLQRAVDDADGRWTVEQLLDDVARCEVMVWVVTDEDHEIKGVFTTRIIQSRVKWLLIEDLAGEDLSEWINEAHAKVEAWARELGVEQILIEGRRGWERTLKPLGYMPTRTTCVKMLRTLQ